MSSGYGDPETTRRAIAAGFDAHLVKPFDVSRLPGLTGEAASRRRDPAVVPAQAGTHAEGA